MNTPTSVLKSPITLSPKIILYLILKEKWLSIFIRDCLECQDIKHFKMKIQTAPTQPLSEHASFFNYRSSMDTKGPINSP